MPNTTQSFPRNWRDLLHTPIGGIVAGTVAVVLLTVVRWLLQDMTRRGSSSAPGEDFGVLLYFGAAAAAAWVWGWRAALFTTLLGALALPLPLIEPRMTGAGSVISICFLLLAMGLFFYALRREQEARVRAEAQVKVLTRERDRLELSEQRAAALQQRAQAVAHEQQMVLATLQKETLTASAPRIRGLRMDLVYEPASGAGLVGGDFYNIFRLSETRAAVILGDITGKGAQAAASGLVVSSMLRALFAESRSPAAVLRRLNNALVEDPDFTSFTTLFAAIVDGEKNTVVYANAGQEEPCLLGPMGQIARLEVTGPVVGMLPESDYEERSLTVPPGHTLVAFTDGLTEIRQSDGTFVDPNRTYARLSEIGGYPPSAITRQMIAWARALSGGKLRDDAALLAIEFEEKPHPLSVRLEDEPRGQEQTNDPFSVGEGIAAR